MAKNRLPQTPTLARTFAIVLVLAPYAASAQGFTEERVASMARERAPSVLVAEREARLASAARAGAGLWPNPEVQWGRQHVLDTPISSQDIVQLNVPIVLSGRLSAESSLAAAHAYGIEADAMLAREDAVAAVLEVYYQAIAAERRVAIAEGLVAALQEGARVLERRQAAGAAPGLDRVRVELEAQLAQSRAASDRAEVEAARRTLASLLGLEEISDELRASLELRELPALVVLLERALAIHPAIQAVEHARNASNDAARAADLAWIPDLVLTGGVDFEQEMTLRTGYVVGVTLELPFFSNGQGLRAEAAARRALADAQQDLLASRIRARVGAAHARLASATAELARFEAATAEQTELLVRASSASYLEGRAPLLELLDAHRTANQITLRRLELALEAKRAEVVLRITTGELR